MATDAQLLEKLQEFFKNDPLKCEIVDGEDAIDAATERHAKEGRRLAAVSNAGLPDGKLRLSFLPESAFRK